MHYGLLSDVMLLLLFLIVYLGGWHDNQPHMQYFYIM